MSIGTLNILGYTRKGKHFFSLELSSLTEPIKFMKLRWPNDIYICGDYIYNHYYLNVDNAASGDRGTIVQSKNFYMSPEKITAMILLDDKAKRRTGATESNQPPL